MGHLVSSGPKVLIGADGARTENFLDGLDPRSRLLAALFFAILVVSLKSLAVLALGGGIGTNVSWLRALIRSVYGTSSRESA